MWRDIDPRDDERDRRDDCFAVPLRAHRHRVFADGNGDAERDGRFGSGPDTGVELGVFTGMTGGGHPVARQLDRREVAR